MYRWKIAVGVTARSMKLLATDAEGHEVLKAALPPRPQHPRALLTLLEGVALWAGKPIVAVISAGPSLPRGIDEALFGVDLVPMESPLVRFEVVEPRRGRRRTLSGLGDFRQLRLVDQRWT